MRAINLGCNGVMVDASHKPLQENLNVSREVVKMALGCGVSVEGELDYVPGLEGEDAERHPGEADYTTPGEAMTYVEKTGKNTSNEYTGLVKNISAIVADEGERCMHLWGSAGRSTEVLAQCRPWTPVEHLIIYNVEGLDKSGAEMMIAEGRRGLSAIPGVREVFTGESVKKDASYRYTWLVRFCHPTVIDSYRGHPAHVAFADKRFRPVAGERISIDYQALEGDDVYTGGDSQSK